MVEYPRYQGDFADNEIRFVRKDHAIYKIKIIDSKNQAGNNWIKIDLAGN